MKFSELIEHCIECIKTFNPIIKTIDSHADAYISEVKNSNFMLTFQLKDPYERVFIKQVFYGVTRYADFLKVSTASLTDFRPSHAFCLSVTRRPRIVTTQCFTRSLRTFASLGLRSFR